MIQSLFQRLAAVAAPASGESRRFSRLRPTSLALAGYAAFFHGPSLVLRTIPAGVGRMPAPPAGFFAFRQRPDLPAGHGPAPAAAGAVIPNIFSKSVPH